MAEPDDDIERRLRIGLMQAEIANKRADTDNKRADADYKRKLTDWEPWKAMAVVAGSVAALFTLIGGALGWLLAHVH